EIPVQRRKQKLLRVFLVESVLPERLAAIRMGAILGGATNAQLGHLTAYADATGRAFQLADDLLDVTASPATLGKNTNKDAAANKQTLVARVGIEAARRHLGDIVHDAITALTAFGPEADILREAARYVATRGN
ncbi:MAG: polyprenyl synthetase family protein, partial [Devosia sp.]